MSEYQEKLKELNERMNALNDKYEKENQERDDIIKKRNMPKMRKPEVIENEFYELSKQLQIDANELIGKYDSFVPEVKEQKLKEANENLTNTYLSKADQLLKELNSANNNLTIQKLEAEYPFFKSTDVNKQIIGNSLINEADSFMTQKHKAETIIEAIKDASELGRLDFASRIINTILKTEVDSFKGQELKQKTLELKNEIFSNTKLIEHENDITQYKVLINDVNGFREAVQSGFNYYITSNQVHSLTDSQTADYIENINASMQYWKN